MGKKSIVVVSIILFLLIPVFMINNPFQDNFTKKNTPIHNPNDITQDLIKKSGSYNEAYIFIDNNWSDTESTYDWCYGEGTSEKPYVIENVTINGGGVGIGIYILNTTEDFIIRNCTIYNCGGGSLKVGIKLINTSNGQLIDNNCSFNDVTGVYAEGAYNCSISGNLITNNMWNGIELKNCSIINITNNHEIYKNGNYGIKNQDCNTIKIFQNNISENDEDGIYCKLNNNTEISKNNIFNHDRDGIRIENSNYSKISDNLLNNINLDGIYIRESHHNIISNNNLTKCYDGIELSQSNHNILIKNNVSKSTDRGLYLVLSHNNTIENNKLKWNNDGLVFSSCYSNNITRNDIFFTSLQGILLENSNNNTFINNTINNNFGNGIKLEDSNDNDIINNTIKENQNYGIHVSNSNNTNILRNNITENIGAGIVIDEDSNYCKLLENRFRKCGLWFTESTKKSHTIDKTNLVNNRTLYYYKDKENLKQIDFINGGQVILINCNRSDISNLNCSETSIGIFLYKCYNTTISYCDLNNNSKCGIASYYSNNSRILKNNIDNNTLYGILIFNSEVNNISENNMDLNNLAGLYIMFSNNNTVYNNSISKNKQVGIWTSFSSNNSIIRNNINETGLSVAIYCYYGNNNNISLNCFYKNVAGIFLRDINYTKVINNEFYNCSSYGIYTVSSCHNNFTGNYFEFSPCGVNLTDFSIFNGINENTFNNYTVGYFNDTTCYANLFYSNYFNVPRPNGNEENNDIFIPAETEGDDNDDDSINTNPLTEEQVATIIVASTVAGSAGVASVATVYYFYGSKRAAKLIQKLGKNKVKKLKKKSSKKLKKKKMQKIEVFSKSAKDILTELSNKKDLLELFDKYQTPEEITTLMDKNITLISDKFLFKVDEIGFSDLFKREFMKEMISFNPNDRVIISDAIIKDLAIYLLPPPIPEKEEKNSLTPILAYEDRTLEFIQEYLEQNRQFNVKKIIPYLSSRFAKSSVNININGIKEILRSLVEKNILIEGSTLIKENVLFNQNRSEIYEFVIKNPGTHFNKLIREIDLPNAVARWHLNVLLKFDFIRTTKIDNHEAYFEKFVNPEYDRVLHLIFREKYRQIIEYLRDNDYGVSKTQLSRELGMHLNTITKYLNKLEELKLITQEKISNKILFFLNEEYYLEIKEEIEHRIENIDKNNVLDNNN